MTPDSFAAQAFDKLAADIRSRSSLGDLWRSIDRSVMEQQLKPAWLKILREVPGLQETALNGVALGIVRRRNEAALSRLVALREEWKNQALDDATPPNLAALLQACAAQLTDLEHLLRRDERA